MDYSTDSPNDPHPRRHKEFEDPHYHDADDVEAPDDAASEKKPNPRRKPARRIPPPVRRRFED